jgi:hypothetical protein
MYGLGLTFVELNHYKRLAAELCPAPYGPLTQKVRLK